MVFRFIQLFSLVILGFVFWNYYKMKHAATPSTVRAQKSAFELALECRCDKEDIETPELTVVRVLTDDRWIVQSASGQTLALIRTARNCDKLNLKKGDHLKAKGPFRWTNNGGTIEMAPAGSCVTPIFVQP